MRIAASGIEASGGYERGVVRALLAAGMSVRQINPFKLRQSAKACGVLAKNDWLDAPMIALFVATMPTRSAQRYQAVERLAEIVTARRQLSDHPWTTTEPNYSDGMPKRPSASPCMSARERPWSPSFHLAGFRSSRCFSLTDAGFEID